MNRYVTKLAQKKLSDIKQELGRSHLIVALLAFVIIVLLLQGAIQPMSYDLTLVTISSALLLVVIFISLSVSYAFLSKKK